MAHETIHCPQFYKLGFWHSKPVADIPDWKWEGYAEYVSRQHHDQQDLQQKAYLKDIDDIYVTDAYHSLSIERYRVTPELIERVSSGTWDAIEHEADRKQRDAMAARGYYQAFRSVKETITAILQGVNSGIRVGRDHGKWYRELFDPSVMAGILKAVDLSGYRNHQVYIGNSKHVPLNVDAMRDAMPILFELLEDEPEASVRAVLGHFILFLFLFIPTWMEMVEWDVF